MRNIPNATNPAYLIPKTSRDDVRRQTKTPTDAPVLISVGSLTTEKRLDRLFRVTQNVCSRLPHLHLWLVGAGSQEHVLRQQAHSLGIADNVRFLGTQAYVADYLNAADLFVLTSDTEGIPAVILEAGLLGLPVIATRVGGIPECVLDGETGVMVDRQDEQGLAEVVCALWQNSVRRHELGKKAKNWVRENFTIEKIAMDYIDFYESVLEARNQRAAVLDAIHHEFA